MIHWPGLAREGRRGPFGGRGPRTAIPHPLRVLRDLRGTAPWKDRGKETTKQKKEHEEEAYKTITRLRISIRLARFRLCRARKMNTPRIPE